jgi:hypothetical protein
MLFPSITVTNLALGKKVLGSSLFKDFLSNETWHNAVDGLKNVTDLNLLFATDYEFYPWLTVTLERLSFVKSVTLYNRADEHGKSVAAEASECHTLPRGRYSW